jgi:hypothetical protein
MLIAMPVSMPFLTLCCREWAAAVREADPEFFNRLVNQQQPEFLWIGCSDSRVPVSGFDPESGCHMVAGAAIVAAVHEQGLQDRQPLSIH